RAMRALFDRFYDENLKGKAASAEFSRHQIVTLASLIEKEAKTTEEKYLISGIFRNRLRERWYLESCATVRYVLKKWSGPLLYEDLKAPSPYNTYRRLGLPPGPICSPGRVALLASVEPQDTDLFFFVADDEGTHQFSKYLKDHVRLKKERKKRLTLEKSGK
ncbi:MAG TPA: endolytic transglycosylase MltG, partial [bacterium]|nr:endolytic transglycosylase MltG [bacterium]